MGGHVPAVGKQRHRAEYAPPTISPTIMAVGQRHDQPDPALVARMLLAEENVIVGPLGQRNANA